MESGRLVRRGRIETRWDEDCQELNTSYTNGDFYRCLTYKPYKFTSEPRYANGRINFEVSLEPGEKWQADCNYILVDDRHVRAEPTNLTYESAVNTDIINTEIERLHQQ